MRGTVTHDASRIYGEEMCGRYVLAGEPDDYVEYFSVDRVVTEAIASSYNVAPTDLVYAIAEWDGERLLGTMRWGFVPFWEENRSAIQINARAESVATKPMFRDALRRKRCIIPADGFYEWEPRERGRTPHWIGRADGFPMAFAGIYASFREPDTGRLVRTCAIITTRATGVVSPIHDRMPVSLDPESWDTWLDRDITEPDQIESLLRNIDPDEIVEHAVSKAVNNVRNNGRELTEPVPPETLF
jgi:putative SOS response-associated peptidase YedK